MLNILVYNRSSKSLSQTVWNAALCLPKTSSWTGRGWPMPHLLCVLWRTISHFSMACTYRAGKHWASRALSVKWRDYLKVSRLNIYYVSYWSTTIEHSTISWISLLANHFITNMFIFHQQMLEVLSVPPLFLLDSGHSCGFRWNSGGIYQPKFHSCHEIVHFRYLHRNGPRSLVTGMAPESSDRNWDETFQIWKLLHFHMKNGNKIRKK